MLFDNDWFLKFNLLLFLVEIGLKFSDIVCLVGVLVIIVSYVINGKVV